MFTSCQQQDDALSPQQQEEQYSYYFNGALSGSPIDLSQEGLAILLVSQEDDQSKSIRHSFHVYEDAEALYTWADAQRIPLRRNHAIGEHLADYAETSGAIREAELTGESPEWYEEYASLYIERMTGKSSASRAPGTIFKDYAGGGSWSYAAFMAFMPPGWNNKTSAYQHYSLYSLTTFYDKSFFRKKMLDHWIDGFFKVLFSGPLLPFNDRTSSLLSPI